MSKLLNLLIVLAILSNFRLELKPSASLNETRSPAPVKQGPVYSPLRLKPHPKIFSKA